MGHTDEELLAHRKTLEASGATQRARLSAQQVDLIQPRTMRLTFSAPNQQAARELAGAMMRNDMGRPVIAAPDDESTKRWRVATAMAASVDFMTARDNLVTFILFADKFDCDFDGWTTDGIAG